MSWRARNVGGILLAVLFGVLPCYAGDSGTRALFPLVPFVLQLGLLTFAALAGGRLFSRIGLPKMSGQLLSGILVGPWLLGGFSLSLMPGGFMDPAFAPLASRGPFDGILLIALAVLFFLMGQETSFRWIRHTSKRGMLIGTGGFFACFFALHAGLTRIPAGEWGGGVSMAPFSPLPLCICSLVSASAIGIVAKILADHRNLESALSPVALTATRVDNILGVVCFTLFGSFFLTDPGSAIQGWGSLLGRGTRFVWAAALLLAFGLPLARKLDSYALRTKNYAGAFTVAVSMTLVASGVGTLFGIPLIFSAYILGMAFSRTDIRHDIRKRFDFVGNFLIPPCIAALGAMINPHLLADSGTLVLTLCLLAGAVLPKFLVSTLLSRCMSLPFCLSLQMGMLTLPRAEVSQTLLLALVLLAPAFPPELLFALVFSFLISCLLSRPAVLCVMKFGRDTFCCNCCEPRSVRIPFDFPNHRAALMVLGRIVDLFEDDGFYATLLNRYQDLYQISRKSRTLLVQVQDHQILFECTEGDRSLVNTFMLECMANIGQRLAELQKPFSNLYLQSLVPGGDVASERSKLVQSAIRIQTLRPRIKSTTRRGAYAELLQAMREINAVEHTDEVLEALMLREESFSSALEHGVAIPHLRTRHVKRLVCAVGLKREGLAFGAADGLPTRIVVLILAPDDVAVPQLQTIAQVCRQLDERGRVDLLDCATAEDMYHILTRPQVRRCGGAAGTSPDLPDNLISWLNISLDMAFETSGERISRLLALCARGGAVTDPEGILEDVRDNSDRLKEKAFGALTFFTCPTVNAPFFQTDT